MSFEIQGKLHEIFDEVQVSDKFKKREFVLETMDGSFTQHIKFQLTQDKCDLLNKFQLNQEIKVSFNLSGRKVQKNGQNMYFTNLNAWRLEGASSGNAPGNWPEDHGNMTEPMGSSSEDELPF